jgi:glycosyltransferase involved in cell wall biosynthesis
MPMRLGYLYSRYPVISQTFCDAEMLALERRGVDLEIGSVYPPLTSLRHEHIARLRAAIQYAPPQKILKVSEKNVKTGRTTGKWPCELIERHEQKYGPGVKAEQLARNAFYFAEFFSRNGVDHVHVHFANRAAHTALFLKEISGIRFTITAHGQDFMKDLGSDDLLREICATAEFVAAETDYSSELLRRRCPDSAAKIYRVYNGIDLEHFPTPVSAMTNPVPRIISVGRLVAFKGFEHLVDACAELARRGFDFVCDIIGDGPLHDVLQARINTLNLSRRISLHGSLSQQAVFEKLQTADIFALASVTDDQGASDVFPTVILEAMASARPVVSTRLAGIPELVVDGQTGTLVLPGDPITLSQALEQLLRDRELRLHYGRSGRARIEQHFRIEKTVEPLLQLFQAVVGKLRNIDFQSVRAAPKAFRAESRTAENLSAGHTGSMPMFRSAAIAYLIDRWPDNDLPLLEPELEAMKRASRTRGMPIVPIVCEFNSGVRLNRAMEQIALSLEFLPDAMVIEAEWRANTSLVQELEEKRAQQKNRVPGAIFLRQARFALVLRTLLARKNVSHVHATSSRALVCALLLKEWLDVTVSATIEREPELPQAWIRDALSECVGGRVSDRKIRVGLDGRFIAEPKPRRWRRPFGPIGAHINEQFLQQWRNQLEAWSR